MSNEKTRHQDRTGKTNQQSGEATEEIAIEATSNQLLERRIWDIAATGVSLCASRIKAVEDVASTRGKRSHDCKITREYKQASSEAEKKKEGDYQWDYDRVVEGLPRTRWDIIRITNEWNLSMNSIG